MAIELANDQNYGPRRGSDDRMEQRRHSMIELAEEQTQNFINGGGPKITVVGGRRRRQQCRG